VQGGSRGPIPNKDDERPLLFRPILLHNVARIVYLVVVQLCACRRLSPRLVLFLELAQDLDVEPFNGRMLALELRVHVHPTAHRCTPMPRYRTATGVAVGKAQPALRR
jgi:hypothetical protein